MIGKHMPQQHQTQPWGVEHNFKTLKKCKTKFACLLYEMLFINDLNPPLDIQRDSLRSKLFYLNFFDFF